MPLNRQHYNRRMKLRIQDNSIRFRLTRSEVEKLVTEGRVENTIRFTQAPDSALTYAVETSDWCADTQVQSASNGIRITLPRSLAQTWAKTDQVSIERLQPVGTDSALRILVEKDFQCLHGGVSSREENAGDLFPNPKDAESVKK